MKAFLFTYFLSHLNDSKSKVLGLTGTKAEFNVFQTNKNDILNNTNHHSLTRIRNNFIYLIENLNGKTFIVCQLFNQLKDDETYDWIDQVRMKTFKFP